MTYRVQIVFSDGRQQWKRGLTSMRQAMYVAETVLENGAVLVNLFHGAEYRGSVS